MRPLLSVVTALLAGACGSQATSPVGVDGSEFTLVQAADSVPVPFGKIVRVGEVFLQLGDVSDSRCPRGVVCVWEGDGVATLAIHPPCYRQGCKAASVVVELHTFLQPHAGTGWGHRVELVGLQPGPVAGQQIDKARYIAWVRVTKTA